MAVRNNLKATIALTHDDKVTRADMLTEADAIDAIGTRVYSRIRAAIRRHIGASAPTHIDDMITRAAATGAVKAGETSKSIARLTSKALTELVVTWCKSGAGIIIIDIPDHSRRRQKTIGGLARVTSSVAMATNNAIPEKVEPSQTTITHPRSYSDAARYAMFVIARLVPQKTAAEPTTIDELVNPVYRTITLDEEQEQDFTRNLFTRNRKATKEALWQVLSELSQPVTCHTRVRGADGRTREKELQHVRLIDYTREKDKNDPTQTRLRINVSGLFYANARHHADINISLLTDRRREVNGAEYTDMIMWYASEYPHIIAAKEGTTATFLFTSVSEYRTASAAMQRWKRRRYRATAEKVTHDIGAASWIYSSTGISFTWNKPPIGAPITTTMWQKSSMKAHTIEHESSHTRA